MLDPVKILQRMLISLFWQTIEVGADYLNCLPNMPSVDCGSNVILISKIWLWCLDPCCVCILPSSFPLPHCPLLLGVILGGDLIHVLVLKPFGMFSWISFTDVYLGGRLGTSYAAYEISFSSFLLLKIGSQGLSFLMHFL